MSDLKRLRDEIDSIDDRLLSLLNRRAKIVLEIGRIKRREGTSFYSPLRESEILQRLTSTNKGPFPNDALRILFREILSASLSLEEPLKVACLGPLATFTHLAATRYFGTSASIIPVEGIKEVFEAVYSGQAEYGVVPIENSNEGVVSYTLDMFMDFELTIIGEVMLKISHNLLSKSGDKAMIRKVYSHPQATAQCRKWLEKNLPAIPVHETVSTAKAAEIASREKDAAAIASELAAKIYDLWFVEHSIEDSKDNYTRFLVISREPSKRTGKDKTSIMFSTKDRPGALFHILEPFKEAKINLTKIESRPSKRKAWEYIFFVDLEGHMVDKKLKKAIERVREHCLYLKILGSYPSGEING
ncbi:MAG TPA: prephenate dehydratase [Thermodesulfovibrionales bacterium]|nr:prephenate dehydratase [Thermodesulfovibrionales bacterium]